MNRVKSRRFSRFASNSGKLLHTHHFAIGAVFTLIIVGLLVVANIGMDVLTSMRAYVGGEGLWSKAQKDAVHYLLRYGSSRSEQDYRQYLEAIRVPLADHNARMELERPTVDRDRAGRAFIAGRNHPDDVDGMVNLFLRYHWEPHIHHAIQVWATADTNLQGLSRLGEAVHEEIAKSSPDQNRVDALLTQVDALNEEFPRLEDDFSQSLGQAARYARTLVFTALMAGALLALLLGLLVSYRLIVRAREADEQYRHLFETASDAVIIAEHETGIILDANAKLAELTGIPVAELLGTEQRALFGREIPAVHGSSDISSGDLVIRHVGGASIPVDVRTNQGRFRRRLVDYSIVRDIRDRRRMEEKLRDVARMESVGRLAGGIAHDFNNLLMVITGHCQALKRVTRNETQEKVDQIGAAADRAARLVRQLLAFSRKQPLEPQALNLNRVIKAMENMIRGVLNEQIELVLDLAPALGAVEADAHQLEQIVLNLATNARDAMPNQGRLTIRTWNEDAAPLRCVGFSISDTGQGMDPATQSRVFEPFFTTKPQGKGSGLGLATVYGTVQQSRGQIFVQSEVGKGTTFRILLPRAENPVQEKAEVFNIEPGRGAETVLLVEDDPGVQQVLARGLEQEGYRVFLAANGREALDQFREYRDEIAVLVTDLVMPEMGGIALGEQLREAGAEIPIVYVSGYHQDLEKHGSEQLPLGAGFLLKPFSPQTLASVIRRALAARTVAGAKAG
jgi:two-component system cell cycle sensor histidine kinase/response regulator CckA